MSPARSNLLRLLGAFTAVYLFWGGTFLAIRWVVAEVPPFATMAIRCAGGAVLLFGWLAVRRKLESTTPAQWGTALLAGTLLFLGCHGILATVEQRVASGEAALLMTSIPLALVAIGAIRTRSLPRPAVLIGLGLGILGIAVLAGSTASGGTVGDRLALGLGGVLWGMGSMVGRHGPRPASIAQSSAMQLAAGALVLAIASLASGEPALRVTAISARSAWALGFLIVCGTFLGFAAYNWLLAVTTPAAAGSYAFVNPVVAVALAWLAGDGVPDGRTAIAAVLVVVAVVLTIERGGSAPGPATVTSGPAVRPTGA